MNDSTPPTGHNPLAALLAEAIALAVENPRTRDALRALLAPSPSPAGERVDARGLAHALRVSTATISRLTAGGMPYDVVGSRRRYDIAACRAWLTARGAVAAPKNHTPRMPADSGVDVTDVPGLRRAGAR